MLPPKTIIVQNKEQNGWALLNVKEKTFFHYVISGTTLCNTYAPTTALLKTLPYNCVVHICPVCNIEVKKGGEKI